MKMEYRRDGEDLMVAGLAGNPAGRILEFEELTWLPLAAAGLQGFRQNFGQENKAQNGQDGTHHY